MRYEWSLISAAYSCLSDPVQKAEYDAVAPLRAKVVAFYEEKNPCKFPPDAMLM
jgi:hypothetical protein